MLRFDIVLVCVIGLWYLGKRRQNKPWASWTQL